MTQVIKLENGITCIVDQRKGAGKVAMTIGIKHGTMHDDVSEAGLLNLTQESTNGGTLTRTRDEISDTAESMGSFIATVSEKDHTVFFSEALKQHATKIFDILAEMVRDPVFDPAEVEKTKKQIAMDIEAKKQSPVEVAKENVIAASFGGQALGQPVAGTKEQLDSYTVQQVKDKHAELIADPSRIVISFSGDITPQKAQNLVKSYFGDMAPAASLKLDPEIEFTGGDIRDEAPGKQLNLLLSMPAPGTNDPDNAAFMLFNELLSGGMSRPLFQEIREKRSLVYTVQSMYRTYDDQGQFLMYAGTGKGRAGELVDAALDLLGEVITNGFTEEEMEQARKRILNGKKEDLETTMSTAKANMLEVMKKGDLVSAEDLEAKLVAVSNDDVKRVAAQMLKSGKYGFGGKGPHETLQDDKYIADKMKEKAALLDLSLTQIAKSMFGKTPKGVEMNPITEEKSPQVTELANGLRIVTIERPGTVSCGAWVGAGASHETPELNGATHMNEHMMFKGTPSYAEGEIDRVIEGKYAAALNAYTTFDQTAYYFYQMDARDMSDVLDICGEMVFEALITKEDYEGTAVEKEDGTFEGARGERAVVLEEIQRAEDNVGRQVMILGLGLAYPDQSSGRPVLGTKETLMNMTADDLRAYRDEYYAPNNVTFVAAGPVKHEDHVAMIEKKFGHLKTSNFPDLPTPEYVGGTAYESSPHAGLVNFDISVDAPKPSDDDFVAYKVLSTILGGGQSSRLTKSIVLDKQLAPSVNVSAWGLASHGMFGVNTQVAAEDVKDTVQAIYDEFYDVIENLDEDELYKAQIMIEMGLRNAHQNNRDIARTAGQDMIRGGEIKDLDDKISDVQRVSIEDVKAAARRFLTSNPSMSIVVPEGTDPKLLPTHEEVLEMQASGSQPQNGVSHTYKPQI